MRAGLYFHQDDESDDIYDYDYKMAVSQPLFERPPNIKINNIEQQKSQSSILIPQSPYERIQINQE